jgi:hypothetical protein
MDYGSLIRRPFDIVIRRPYLWLLGFLAGGASTFNWTSSGTSNHSGGYPTTAALQTFWNDHWGWIVGLVGAFLVIGLVLFILGCIATGGIIHAAVEHDDGHDYRLGTAWRAGSPTFWRILTLKLLTFVLAIAPVVVIGSFVGATAVLAKTAVLAAVVFGLAAAAAAFVAIFFWIVLGVASELAARFIVLENGHVFDGLGDALRMVRHHFKDVALGWLILVALSIAAGVALAIVFAIIAIPAFAIGFAGWLVGGTSGAIVLGTFAAVFYVGILLAVAGAYSAYSSVYWTLLFRNVRAMPAPATRGAIQPAG